MVRAYVCWGRSENEALRNREIHLLVPWSSVRVVVKGIWHLTVPWEEERHVLFFYCKLCKYVGIQHLHSQELPADIWTIISSTLYCKRLLPIFLKNKTPAKDARLHSWSNAVQSEKGPGSNGVGPVLVTTCHGAPSVPSVPLERRARDTSPDSATKQDFSSSWARTLWECSGKLSQMLRLLHKANP